MSCRGDLLDLLEARERVNRDLKRQDERVRVAGENVADLVTVRNELFATWRLVNNELANAAANVWPEEGPAVEDVPDMPGLVHHMDEPVEPTDVEAERADMRAHYDPEEDLDEPMEGNEVPEPWDG